MFTFFEKVRYEYSRYGERSLKDKKIEGGIELAALLYL